MDISTAAVDAYHALHTDEPCYLYFLPGSAPREPGTCPLRFSMTDVAGWQLADPHPERGFTSRVALIARVTEIARRLPILTDEGR